MSGVVDLYLVYRVLRRLTTPFESWEAYKLGIIDAKGNILKKRRDLDRVAEREAFTLFDLMILNMKKALAVIPGGSTKVATYAAALWLIREFREDASEQQLTEAVNRYAGLPLLKEEEVLSEEVSVAERRRRAITMRRYRSKLKVARARAERRKAPDEKLKERARRHARDMLRQRFLQGRKYAELSPQEKVQVDRRLAKLPAAVFDRIAVKQLPRLRRDELQRVANLTGDAEVAH
jgi:hypothetical protein